MRIAGNGCRRAETDYEYCQCTPYKQNTNGTKPCKHIFIYHTIPYGDVGKINKYSYIQYSVCGQYIQKYSLKQK